MAEERQLYSIESIQRDDDEAEISFNVFVADKYFRIDITTDCFLGDSELLNRYLRYLQRTEPAYADIDLELHGIDEDELGKAIEEFHAWIMEPFIPIFRRIPPLAGQPPRYYTLQDILYPERFLYTLQIPDEFLALAPVELDGEPDSIAGGDVLPNSTSLSSLGFRIYSPSEIFVRLRDDATSLSLRVHRVQLGSESGRMAFFKKIRPGDGARALSELSTHAKIAAASSHFDREVRVQRLIGVVQDPYTTRILGLLFEYIFADKRNRLRAMANSASSESLIKWVEQVRHSLEALHANDIVWGDPSTNNILIDRYDGNAYIVNFGAPGGTMEGDLDRIWGAE